jgi:predicted RNase H-like nuclease
VKEKARKTHHFIGIDLAWSARNPSGLAALRWDGAVATLVEPLPEALAYSVQEIADYIGKVTLWGGVVVAIDAPLTVPNVTGRRPGETELNAVFARFHAGAHPANRQRLAGYNGGKVRGEELLSLLSSLDIQHNPIIVPRQQVRQAFEAYPHPAMITLFRLNRILKYKARPTISHAQRLGEFQRYQHHLRNLQKAEPRVVLPRALLSETHLTKRGRALKAYEDQLDAVFCAYIALYYWWWGTERCRIFGDVARGYIVAPVDERVCL